MLWSRTEPPKPPSAPTSVLHSQALLRSALQASWKRDRRVGLRRLALRWLAWAFLRYGLPVMVVVATAVTLSVWLLPSLHQTWAVTQQSRPQPVAPPAQTPLVPPSAPIAPTAPIPDATANTVDTGTLQLNLDKTLTSRRTLPGNTPLSPTEIEPIHNPTLKPEYWLHSKEP